MSSDALKLPGKGRLCAAATAAKASDAKPRPFAPKSVVAANLMLFAALFAPERVSSAGITRTVTLTPWLFLSMLTSNDDANARSASSTERVEPPSPVEEAVVAASARRALKRGSELGDNVLAPAILTESVSKNSTAFPFEN